LEPTIFVIFAIWIIELVKFSIILHFDFAKLFL